MVVVVVVVVVVVGLLLSSAARYRLGLAKNGSKDVFCFLDRSKRRFRSGKGDPTARGRICRSVVLQKGN